MATLAIIAGAVIFGLWAFCYILAALINLRLDKHWKD